MFQGFELTSCHSYLQWWTEQWRISKTNIYWWYTLDYGIYHGNRIKTTTDSTEKASLIVVDANTIDKISVVRGKICQKARPREVTFPNCENAKEFERRHSKLKILRRVFCAPIFSQGQPSRHKEDFEISVQSCQNLKLSSILLLLQALNVRKWGVIAACSKAQ